MKLLRLNGIVIQDNLTRVIYQKEYFTKIFIDEDLKR